MRKKAWTEADLKISYDNSKPFEEWCKANGVRYTSAPIYVAKWGLVPPTPKTDNMYHIWCKWPDKIVMCKLAWGGL